MASELVSPELALVDPALAARARAALPDPRPPVRRTLAPPAASAPAPAQPERHYPAWARVTAALWLLVLGILVGGAAIPHAQDKPRVIPANDDAVVTVCRPVTTAPAPDTTPTVPTLPRGHIGGP